MSQSTPKVIIIGSARKLKESGYDVVVLEGRNRIGGRLYTDTEKFGYPLDFGASNLKFHSTDTEAIISPDGERIGHLVEKKLGDKVWKIFDDLKDVSNNNSKCDYTVEAGMRSVKEFLALNQEKILADLSPQERKYFMHIFMCMEDHVGENFEKVGLINGIGTDIELEGDHIVFQKGYINFLNFIAGDEVLSMVRLEHVAERVIEDLDDFGKQRMIVKTNKGDFIGDLVLVTVPVGVLKAKKIAFHPPLPKWKQGAIDRIGYGLFNKIFIEFEEAFWPEDVDLFTVCSEADEDFSVKDHQHDKMTPEDPFNLTFVNLKRIAGVPTLIGLLHSERARYFETLADDKVLEICRRKLERAYKKISKVTKYHITRWNSDPFSYGSYSHIAVGSSGHDVDLLADPIGNSIYFAGEATYRKFYSTVHGAYASGIVAHERILSDWPLSKN